jgi:hypothetical protein
MHEYGKAGRKLMTREMFHDFLHLARALHVPCATNFRGPGLFHQQQGGQHLADVVGMCGITPRELLDRGVLPLPVGLHELVGLQIGSYDPTRALVIDFPVENPLAGSLEGDSAAFVTQVSADGSTLGYSTYVGGNHTTAGTGIAVDNLGDIYVAGTTTTTGSVLLPNFPVGPGAFQPAPGGGTDGFVTKILPGGQLVGWSTYFGGSADDTITALAVDTYGRATVAGATLSTDLPTHNAAQSTNAGGVDGFVGQLTADGTGAVFVTYLGGGSSDEPPSPDTGQAPPGNDDIRSLALGEDGSIYVTGATTSTDFPVKEGFVGAEAGIGSLSDVFITRLAADGSLDASCYDGGAGDDFGNGIAVNPAGAVVIVGATNSEDFPIKGKYQGSNAGGFDAFVVMFETPVDPPVLTAISEDTGISSSDFITYDQNLILYGTAAPDADVKVRLSGVGVVGIATADSYGNWTLDLRNTTLPENNYTFSVTATVDGVESLSATSRRVTIDITRPTVVLDVPAGASTEDTSPEIIVHARDNNTLPRGTRVALDVDLNNDGTFDDPGERDYASTTLTQDDGSAEFQNLTTPLPIGHVRLRARVTDVAGNEGASAVQPLEIVSSTNPWQLTASVASVDSADGMPLEQAGDLHLEHALDLDRSPGTAESLDPSLVYQSSTVSPQPVVQGTLSTDNGAALPSTLHVQLTWDGVDRPVQSFSTAGFRPGQLLTFAVEAPPVAETGRYRYTLHVTADYGDPDLDIVRSQSGYTFVVNNNDSSIAPGWSFSMVDQLVPIATDGDLPEGVLRVYGSGRWGFYAKVQGEWRLRQPGRGQRHPR